MSEKEIDRYAVLSRVALKQLTQKQAAELLRISPRQVRNLQTRVLKEGARGIVSKHRGRQSNNKKPVQIKKSALALLRERYEGFGPTLASEKLAQWHNIKISAETLRLWMIEAHLWVPRKTRKKNHLPRKRRACFGELIQGDGSHHHWFGEDRPAANLIVLIDDATSKLTSLFFSETETLESYFTALGQHIRRFGRPRALYTDRYAVFCSPNGKGTTQMQRALKELSIELILANSPQAKGRVERANRTLQDRLLKELQLRGIKTIAEANLYTREFIEEYNNRFSKEPMSGVDAHRPLEGYDLGWILCHRETRTLLSDLSFQFNNRFYVMQGVSEIRRTQGKKIQLAVQDGIMRAFIGQQEVKVIPLEEIQQPRVLSRKEVANCQIREYRAQPASHPWKKYGQQFFSKTAEGGR